MKMHNDPHSWPDMYELLQNWWRGDTPIGAVLLAIVMAGLRIAYSGGGWKKMLLEGLLCGALTLTVASGLEYLTIPKTLSVGIGGGSASGQPLPTGESADGICTDHSEKISRPSRCTRLGNDRVK